MKKRFELFEEELEYWIHDHETFKNFGNWDLDCLTDLLNEQDKKIKKQEKVILNNNQKLADAYYVKLYELDEKYNIDLDKRLKKIEKLQQENQQLQKAQNKKAIELLENLKKYIFNKIYPNTPFERMRECSSRDVIEKINNLITELKGEK